MRPDFELRVEDSRALVNFSILFRGRSGVLTGDRLSDTMFHESLAISDEVGATLESDEIDFIVDMIYVEELDDAVEFCAVQKR